MKNQNKVTFSTISTNLTNRCNELLIFARGCKADFNQVMPVVERNELQLNIGLRWSRDEKKRKNNEKSK